MQDAEYKTCTKCDEPKPRSDFGKHKSTADGLRPECKVCIAEYQRGYRERNAEALRIAKGEYSRRTWANQTRQKRRLPCQRCGGVKPPGERRRYCDACAEIRAVEVREQERQRAMTWYRENRDYVRERARKKWRTDPEFAARSRAAVVRWVKENPERAAASRARNRKKWRAANPDRMRVLQQRRQALLLAAFVEDVHPLVLLERDDGVCGICGEDVDPFRFDVDHIVPLSLGGEHSYRNTQPAHPSCNYRKGAKAP